MIWMDRRGGGPGRRASPSGSRRRSSTADVGANLDSSHAAFKALWVRDDGAGRVRGRRAAACRRARTCSARSPACSRSTTRTRRRWRCSIRGRGRGRTRSLEVAGLDAGHAAASWWPATQPVGTGDGGVRRGDRTVARHGGRGGVRRRDGGDARGRRVRAGRRVRRGRARPSRCARRRPSRESTRRCWSSAIRTPTPTSWLLENPGFVSGGNLRWWRDQFRRREREAEARRRRATPTTCCREAAADVPPGAEGVVFLRACRGRWRPSGTGRRGGCSTGSALAHTRAHLTRAVLEGSAFALRDILEAMRGAGLDVRRADDRRAAGRRGRCGGRSRPT